MHHLFKQCFLLVAIAAGFVAGETAQADDAAKAQGNMVVAQFMKALKEEDLDAFAATLGVPWYHDRNEIIESKDKLKEMFEGLFEKRDYSDVEYKVIKAHTYMEFIARVSDSNRELFTKVIKPGDLIFELEVTHQNRSDGLALYVRPGKEKATIVGLSD